MASAGSLEILVGVRLRVTAKRPLWPWELAAERRAAGVIHLEGRS